MAETAFVALGRTGTIGFLMLAGGILILDDRRPLFRYLGHRLHKWLPMLILAQFLYISLSYQLGYFENIDFSWQNFVRPAFYHLWFFYALGFVYLSVIVLRVVARSIERIDPRHRAQVLLASAALFLAWQSLQTAAHDVGGDLRPINFIFYLGYAWLGYVLRVLMPQGSAWGAALMVLGLGAAIGLTVEASLAANGPFETYVLRGAVFLAVAGIGQFLLLLHLARHPALRTIEPVIHAVSLLTLGVFILHPAVLQAIRWPKWWSPMPPTEWLSLPLLALAVFAASAVLTGVSMWGMRLARAWLREYRLARGV